MGGSDTTQQTDDGSLTDILSSGGQSLGQGIATGLGAPGGLNALDFSGAGASFATGALGQVKPFLPYIAIGAAVLLLVTLFRR